MSLLRVHYWGADSAAICCMRIEQLAIDAFKSTDPGITGVLQDVLDTVVSTPPDTRVSPTQHRVLMSCV